MKNAFHIVVLLLVLCGVVSANNPSVKRATLVSPHFFLVIDKEKQAMLPYLAALCEDTYRKLVDTFEYELYRKISIVFMDEDDFANGFAFPAQAWVVVYLPAAQFELRGPTAWLPNAISHELAHLFSLRKLGVKGRFLGSSVSFGGVWDSLSTYEGDFTYRHDDIPRWLAEGLAQHGAQSCGADTLDSYRRMLLKMAFWGGQLMSLKEMTVFAWDSRKNEQIYNQGYFFVSFMVHKMGKSEFNRTLHLASRQGFSKALRVTTGKSLDQWYRNWRQSLGSDFGEPDQRRRHKPATSIPGNIPFIYEKGAVRLTDAGRLYYLSSRKNDHGVTSLFCVDETGGLEKIRDNCNGRLNLNPEGSRLLFSSKKIWALQGKEIDEIYELTIPSGNLVRLTKGLRTFSAAYDADGNRYCLARNRGSTYLGKLENNILLDTLMSPPGQRFIEISRGPAPGTLTLVSVGQIGRDILLYDIKSKRIDPIIHSHHDEGDPFWSNDTLFFTADYDGSYGIYAFINGLIGRAVADEYGAFAPSKTNKSIYFSSYGPKGFTIKSAQMNEFVPIYRLSNKAGNYPKGNTSLDAVSEKDSASVAHKAQPDSDNEQIAAMPHESRSFPSLGQFGLGRTRANGAGIGFIGYALNLNHTRIGSFQVILDDTDTISTPEFDHISMGGEAFFLDPGFRHNLTIRAFMGRSFSGSQSPASVDPGISLTYINDVFLPTWYSRAYFATLSFPDVTHNGEEHHLGQGIVSLETDLQFDLSRYWSMVPGFTTQSAMGGGGFLSSPYLLFMRQRLFYGVDFINSGTSLWGLARSVRFQDLSAAEFGIGGSIHMNMLRMLYVNISGAYHAFNYSPFSRYRSEIGINLPLPLLKIPIKLPFHKSLLLYRPYLSLGATRRDTKTSIYALKGNPGHRLLKRKRLGQSVHGYPEITQLNSADALSVGILTKVIGIFSHYSFWRINCLFDPRNPQKNHYVEINLSL